MQGQVKRCEGRHWIGPL